MRLNPQITFEKVGDGIVALDATESSIISITGKSAQVVRQLLDGVEVGNCDDGVDELVRRGLILPEASQAVSRRSIVAGGVAIGVSGVLAMGLPTLAHASSQMQLPAPSFNFTSGIILSSIISTTGGSGSRTVTLLEFPATRLANASDYPSGFVLEWSLTDGSGFNQEFELKDSGGGVLIFEWTGSVAAGSNYVESNDRLTIFIRARFGMSVSESVEVQFNND